MQLRTKSHGRAPMELGTKSNGAGANGIRHGTKRMWPQRNFMKSKGRGPDRITNEIKLSWAQWNYAPNEILLTLMELHTKSNGHVFNASSHEIKRTWFQCKYARNQTDVERFLGINSYRGSFTLWTVNSKNVAVVRECERFLRINSYRGSFTLWTVNSKNVAVVKE